MTTLMLIILLVIVALALIMAEIITPSFGILGLCAAGSLIYAAFLCFTLSQWAGLGFVLACLIGVPIFLSFMMRVLPETRMGRWLVLGRVEPGQGEGLPESRANSLFIGRQGVAETTLRPVGAVRIDGRRIIAMAEEGYIVAGAEVRVVRLSGSDLVVRPASETEAAAPPRDTATDETADIRNTKANPASPEPRRE